MTRKPQPIREREARAPEAPVFVRHDGRTPRDLRPLKIERGEAKLAFFKLGDIPPI